MPVLPIPDLLLSSSGEDGWPLSGNLQQFPAKMPDGRAWPMISIVTPSFNQAQYLEDTIRTVLLQGYPNLEYIIIDGGSTDGSLEIIKKYEPWLSYWQSEPDAGQYDAIQKGFDHCHGEIMAYLNSDDLYFPWTFSVVAEIFSLFPSIEWLTTSNLAVLPSDGRFYYISQIYNRSRRWFFSTRGNLMKKRGFFPQEATFWRRNLWEKAGSKIDRDLKYAGDFELWSRFFKHASPVMASPPLGLFRYHEEQKTAQLDQYIMEANRVLASFPTPIWIPSILIHLLNFIYRRFNIQTNWLGAQCDKVNFNPRDSSWEYRKYLEWRF